MFNQEVIKSVSNLSATSKIVFEALAKRQRFSRKTNLNKFHQILLNNGCKVIETEYYEVFKKLQELEIGRFIQGKNGSPSKFEWYFDLKGLAKMAFDKSTMKPNTVIQLRPKVDEQFMDVTFKVPATIKPEVLTYIKDLVEGFNKAAWSVGRREDLEMDSPFFV